MYTRATSLPSLYIRNIMPDDMGIPSSASLAYRGGAMRYSPNVGEWGFSEVRYPQATPSNPKQQQRYAVWAMCQNAQFWYGASQEQAEAQNRVPHRRWAPRGVGSQWCNRLPSISPQR